MPEGARDKRILQTPLNGAGESIKKTDTAEAVCTAVPIRIQQQQFCPVFASII